MNKTLRLLLNVALVSLALPLASAQEVVRIAQSLAQTSLNPAESSGLADATVVRTMFEGLVGFDRELEVVPELATSWEVSDDVTTYTFELREGVTFHDGTTFNAEAAKTYYDWVLEPEGIGSRGRSALTGVESVEVMSPNTLRFTLGAPNSAFLFNLALSNLRIASPASLEEYGDEVGRNPVGTGPFRFTEWEDGVSIKVEAFEDYWGEPALVDGLEFLVVTNAATRVAQLQSGEVQFIEALPSQLVESLQAAPNLEVVVQESTFARTFQMNMSKAPFDDVRVRQALNYAVDKEQLINVVFRGYGTVMTSPVPESVFGHAPQEPYAYDPERARQLLEEAGYGDGFSFEVLTFTGDEYSAAGQVLQQYFADIGVDMQLDPAERGALNDQIFLPVEENPTQAALVGASTATGDADRALTVSFSRASWPPDSNNWSFYENAEIDSLIEQGRATADQDERAEIYAQAQAIIWNDAPWVFLYSPNTIAGKLSTLEGVFYALDQTVDARRADLTE